MTVATDAAWYLAGVARGDALDSFEAPGLEGAQRARVVDVGGGFRAVVVEVPGSMFAGEDAEARLQDVAWLAPRAERHEAIVRAARALGALMPVGFGSVFSSLETMRSSIAAHATSISSFLDETRDCDEWSLKAWVSRAAAVERAERALASEHGAGGSGAAYLRARRLAEQAAARAEDRVLERIEGLLDDLGSTIADAAERRTVASEAEPDDWLIAHVALLVRRPSRAAFDARLDELAGPLEAEGIRLELTGPWAPYSFCPPLGEAP